MTKCQLNKYFWDLKRKKHEKIGIIFNIYNVETRNNLTPNVLKRPEDFIKAVLNQETVNDNKQIDIKTKETV